MHWNKKKDAFQQEKKQEDVAVWECKSDNCLGWMRKEFSFTDEPDCPLCGTKMQDGTRLLYVLSE